MFTNQFGLEIEFTGITRTEAAETAVHFLGGTITTPGDYHDTQEIKAPDGRIWKFMYDGSIHCQKKDGRRTVSASGSYSVELVTPILLYREDIDTVQALARRLRKAGGFTNKSCGIHMLDVKMVQWIANRENYFELVIYLEEHRKEYVHYLFTGEAPEAE